jgi:HK97 gp10 family phage protein
MQDIKTGTIEIKGLAELEKELLAFPDRIAKNVLVGGVRAGANVFRDEARQKAQSIINKDHRFFKKKIHGQETIIFPGFTARKIAAWRARKTPYAVTFNTGITGYKDQLSKLFPFWWRWIEFGKSGQSAQPFLRPAFEGKKTAAVEAMRDYLHKRIDKEAKKQVSR